MPICIRYISIQPNVSIFGFELNENILLKLEKMAVREYSNVK